MASKDSIQGELQDAFDAVATCKTIESVEKLLTVYQNFQRLNKMFKSYDAPEKTLDYQNDFLGTKEKFEEYMEKLPELLNRLKAKNPPLPASPS